MPDEANQGLKIAGCGQFASLAAWRRLEPEETRETCPSCPSTADTAIKLLSAHDQTFSVQLSETAVQSTNLLVFESPLPSGLCGLSCRHPYPGTATSQHPNMTSRHIGAVSSSRHR
jgi:hypothetical protein